MINVLGVDIENNLTKNDVLDKFLSFLESDKQHYVVTPNPEIVLQAQIDEELFYILNKADLALADGFGLKIAAFLNGKKLIRTSGSDILPDLLRLAEEKNKKVLIINREDGLSGENDIKLFLENNYPNLNFLIKSTDVRFIIPPRRHLLNIKHNKKYNFLENLVNNFKEKINKGFDALANLNKNNLLNFEADILICNFGAPYQEKFIFHNIKKIPTVKLAIGLGGSFDFLTGKIKRAPKIMRFIGLEWLWRLFKQPKRIKRIFRAVIVFPLKLLHWKFISPFLYRKNVACLLYKKENLNYTALENKNRNHLDFYQILLVERSEELGHWQIPQGGIDNQEIKIAGTRELYEELGISDFTPKKIYKNVFKYKVNRKGRYGFKGQKQGLLIAEFHGKDTDIDLNFWDHRDFKWVRASEFVNSVHPVRRKASEIFLEKFIDYIKTSELN